jgi:acetylornithine deacetylase
MNDLERLVTERIESNKDGLFRLLSRLIQVNTCNYNTCGDEALIAPVILEEYQRLGLKSEIYYPAEVPGILENPDFLPNRGAEKRPNISGVYTSPSASKTIMLAAHTDVMPTGDRDLWSVDPFGGIIKDGRVYGRGANDNKFGIASAIMAMDAIRSSGIELKSNVILEAYCDEEYGGGNGALAASLRYHPDAIINMDGGNYEIWSCSMGGQVMKIGVRALKPQDSSALVVDALLVIREELKTFIENRHIELEGDRYFAHTDMSRSAFRFYEFSAGIGDLGCNLDSGTMSFVFYTNRSREQINEELSSAQARIAALLEKMDVHTEGFEPLTRFFHCLSLPDSATV